MHFVNLISNSLKYVQRSILDYYNVFLKILKGFIKHDGEMSACALAFYLLISFIPASLVVISLLSYFFNSQDMVAFYMDHIKLQLPAFDAEILIGTIDRILYSQRHFAFIWIPFLFWWGSFIFDIFERILERAFRIEKSRKYWKAKLLHFGIILTISFIVLLLSAMSNFFSLMRTMFLIGFIDSDIIKPESIIAFIHSLKEIPLYNSIFNIFINSLLLFTIYKFLPPRKLDTKSLIKGTLLVTIVYDIVKTLFSYYITQINDYTSIFGSLSGIVIFMIWIWFACNVFVFGAEACYVFHKRAKDKASKN